LKKILIFEDALKSIDLLAIAYIVRLRGIYNRTVDLNFSLVVYLSKAWKYGNPNEDVMETRFRYDTFIQTFFILDIGA